MDPANLLSVLKELMEDQRNQQREMMKLLLDRSEAGSGDRFAPEERPNVMAAISNRIEKFVFDPEKEMACSRWYARYKDIFTEEARQLPEGAKVRIICEKLDVVTFEKYQRHVLPKDVSDISFEETIETLKKLFNFKASEFTTKYQCLKLEKSVVEDYLTYTDRVNEFCEKAKLHTLDSDGIKCLLWIFGLKSPTEAEIRQKLISVLDREYKAGRKISLHQLYQECENFLSLKRDCEAIAGNPKAVDAVVKDDRKPIDQCKKKLWFCKKCNRSGHREKFCDAISNASANVNTTRMYITATVNGYPVEFLLDTGSDITLLNHDAWKKMGSPKLEKANITVRNASGDVMKILGKLKCSIEMKGRKSERYAYITPYNSLMGLEWIRSNDEMMHHMSMMVAGITVKHSFNVKKKFERKYHSCIDEKTPPPIAEDPHAQMRRRNTEEQFNRRHGAKRRLFAFGEAVYVKQWKQAQFTWEKGTVKRRLGSVNYEVEVNGKIVKKHANQLARRYDEVASKGGASLKTWLDLLKVRENSKNNPSEGTTDHATDDEKSQRKINQRARSPLGQRPLRRSSRTRRPTDRYRPHFV
ncbi:unnamed protein product [Nippostrongylus brasiliensis]|uniref:Peptidase A2 domain-containing protein n=1 Tax=Nippostrongylus brasiliensis TaxID=27835 RepID=A0A0N4XE05_NIPBR|nr:unnamed protein product [Nippostrongylus brasiliensis]